MKDVPDVVFLIDLKKEQLAVREAKRLKIPVVALVDTNCDPDDADFVIPGNDDAISACSLITRAIADGVEAGKQVLTEREMVAAAERQAAAEAAAKAKAEADRVAAEAAAAEAAAAAASEAEAPAEVPAAAEAPSEGESQ
jgi:small subunit ribosomal protein S2